MNRIRIRLAEHRGIATLEFALGAPVLLLLMLGGFDLTMWIRMTYRLDAVTSQLGEVISQCNQIDDPGDINAFDAAAQQIAGKVDISSQSGGAFVITAIGNVQGASVVLWQKHAGNPLFPSRLGSVNGAGLLGGYSVPAGQVMIGTEAFSNNQPWVLSSKLMKAGPTAPLYSVSTFLVRSSNPNQLSSLTTASATAKACAS